MSIGKLILYPGNTASPPPAIKPLIQTLHKLGLIGQPMDSDTNSFLAGDSFLQLISFVGCSPDICLTPQTNTGSDFCHLTIQGPFEQPQLVWDKNCHPPRCPNCQKPITDWNETFDGTTIKCNLCRTESQPGDFNWRRHGGYGRIFIEINNVFPGEANPVDLLFDRLQKETGVEWKYFFTGHG